MDLMNNEAQPDSNIIYWLWLSLACGAGSSVPELLFKKFGPNPQRIYDAVPEELDELTREKGMRPNIYSALVKVLKYLLKYLIGAAKTEWDFCRMTVYIFLKA